jgi:1,4-alpha-glucan branching enzyme
MMEKGYLAILLHGHLPFVRHPEHEDSLEENWLYEAITEVYIPLLLGMEELVEDGVDFRLSFSLTPTLVSMLQDPFLQSRYMRKIVRLTELAEKEIKRTEGQPDFHTLARMYHQRFCQVREAFLDRYHGDIVGGFQRLQELGKVEIIASAATHGYLPLLSVDPWAAREQVRVGIRHYEAVFGRSPKGFWLPECGYCPGLGELLAEHGIRFTILETHGITHAEPRPRYGVYAPIECPSGLATFGRDPECSKQVWSSVDGYPGDSDYREFYRDIAYERDVDYLTPYIHQHGLRIDSGIKYYRVTGKTEEKQVYVPEWAARKAEIHAGDFMFQRQKQLESLASIMDRTPIVVAPYDAELFGHWWYEGPIWLKSLLRKLAREQHTMRLVTFSEYLAEYPRNQPAVPAASSWGYKGFHEVWIGGKNDWIYRHFHQAALEMERLLGWKGPTDGLRLRALQQARRELLLAQASDWAFMIHGGAMAEYATRRIKLHLQRFQRLAREIEANVIDEAWLSAVEDQDNVFPASVLATA